MSGPRQVRRIAHKAVRLLARDADIYDLSPQAFAKRIGLVVPLNSPGNLSYPGLLGLALNRYYDRNPHLPRPLRLAS